MQTSSAARKPRTKRATSRDFGPDAQRQPHRPARLTTQKTAIGLYAASVVGAVGYARYIFDPSNMGQWWAWLSLVFVMVLNFAKIGVEQLTLLSAQRHEETIAISDWRNRLEAKKWRPTVDVLITVYGEPLELIERTARAALTIRYKHRTVICDDGNSDEVRKLAFRIGCEYLRRPNNVGRKAGNVNHALNVWSKAEFFVLLDADHIPHPEMIHRLLPYFVDEKCGFVQSPQSYYNRFNSATARACHDMQRLFYEAIATGKNGFNAMFSVGTNLIYRRAALDDVLGMYDGSNSEDIWTAFRLHQRGWSTVYVPEVLAEGRAPDDINSYLVQQYRWGRGAFEVLFKGHPWNAQGLVADQRIQYLQPALHYLHSVVMVYFMMLPAAFILFGFQPLRSGSLTWLGAYAPFGFLTWLASTIQVGHQKLWTRILAIAAAPVHLKALVSAIGGKDYGWKATNASRNGRRQIAVMPFHTAMCVVLASAAVIGLVPFRWDTQALIPVVMCASFSIAYGSVIVKATLESLAAK